MNNCKDTSKDNFQNNIKESTKDNINDKIMDRIMDSIKTTSKQLGCDLIVISLVQDSFYKEQAGTELCQAQSKLIQIGRFSGQIYLIYI